MHTLAQGSESFPSAWNGHFELDMVGFPDELLIVNGHYCAYPLFHRGRSRGDVRSSCPYRPRKMNPAKLIEVTV